MPCSSLPRSFSGLSRLQFDELVLSCTEPKICSSFNGMDTVAAVYALHEMFFARIIGCGHQVDACLIYGHRIAFMHGSSATSQQSQSTDRFFITLIKAILSLKCSAMLHAASAMASGKTTLLACSSHVLKRSSVLPAECISAFPAREAQPMASCLRAPPYPPMGWPLKCASTSMES